MFDFVTWKSLWLEKVYETRWFDFSHYIQVLLKRSFRSIPSLLTSCFNFTLCVLINYFFIFYTFIYTCHTIEQMHVGGRCRALWHLGQRSSNSIMTQWMANNHFFVINSKDRTLWQKSSYLPSTLDYMTKK